MTKNTVFLFNSFTDRMGRLSNQSKLNVNLQLSWKKVFLLFNAYQAMGKFSMTTNWQYFSEKIGSDTMQIVSLVDNLHGVSHPIF